MTLRNFIPWKLFLALLVTGVGIVSLSTLILYNTTISTETAKLQALSQSHAKLINSVAQFDYKFNQDFPVGGSRGATLLQIRNARFESIGFGDTGEIVIGENVDGKIHFLIPSRNLGTEIPPVDQDAIAAEPMRRALLGMSGSMRAPDYKEEEVLAWYEPLPDLDAGFVAKIAISEIRTNFVRAALVGFTLAAAASVLASIIFARVTNTHRATQNTTNSGNRRLGHQNVLILTLIGCLVSVGAVSVTGVATYVYNTEFDRQKSELLSLSKGMASLIGAVADFDAMPKAGKVNIRAAEDTISQVKKSTKSNPGFGATGEIVLGVLNGGNIDFLLPSKFTGKPPDSVNFKGKKAEPMRRALSGQSGIIHDLDYRGEIVVAAFQPVPRLDAGLVAKMDIDEIEQPYVLTGVLIVSLSIFVIVLGVMLSPHFVGGMGQASFGQPQSGVYSSDDRDENHAVRRFAPAFIVVFAVFIFLLDYVTPLGVAAGIPYIALLIVGAFFTGEKGIIVMAAMSSVLVFIGWAIAPGESSVFWKAIINRLYALFTIWLAAIILLRTKRAETSTRRSETRIRSIVENASDGIIVVGSDGIVQSFSPAAERIFGYAANEVIGENIRILMPEPMHGEHDGYIENYLKTGEAKVVGTNREVVGLTKDGHEFPMDLTLGESVLDDERIFTGIVRDITDRKRSEDELRNAHDEAQAASRAKAAFLATMSHEIRTPMTGVIGMVDLLTQSKLADDQRQMMNTVRDSAYALLTIINDILDFSKIEAGKLELETIPFSLRDTIEGMAETLSPNANNKGIRISVHVDPDIPDAVLGDQVRVRQILFNIGGNAVKFTEHGRVLVRAYRVAGDDDTKATVRLEVTDSGIGISKEAQASLFQEFSQAESSTNRRFGGTGLGLSIAQRLTEMMGGTIEVESVLGEGSTFTVTVTFDIAEDHQIKSDGHDLNGLKVLFIGDDAEERELDATYLRRWGADVITDGGFESLATTLLQASQEGSPFDIVVLGSAWDHDTCATQIDAVRNENNLSDTRFLIMTRTRSKAERKPIENAFYVDSDPLRRAPFIRAAAVAAGRASPDIDYDDDDDMLEKVRTPTVEEAEAAGALILVAEDNTTNQTVIRRQINMLGYAVEMVDDGKQALDALQSGRYAILLTDCHMPEMDGFQLTQEVRKREAGTGKRLPIVAITASVLAAEIDRCYEAGMDDSLGKPLEIPKLKAALRKWMPSYTPEPASEPKPEAPSTPDNTEKPGGGGESVEAIDPSALISMFGDDEETFKEILGDFVAPSTANVEDMLSAVEEHSSDTVGAEAHKLKSSARSVGAHALADLCQALEAAGKSGDWDTINDLAPQLTKTLEDVVAYIRKL